MASRPYQPYSEAELLDLKRGLDARLRDVDRERDDYIRRNPHAVGGPGMQEIESKAGRIWNEVSSINQELEIRRNAGRGL